MEVRLTPDQQAFVRHAIETGRVHNEQEAVQEAFSLWEERERRRVELLSELNAAQASLDRGEGRTVHESSIQEMTRDIKSRGRARLRGQKPPR